MCMRLSISLNWSWVKYLAGNVYIIHAYGCILNIPQSHTFHFHEFLLTFSSLILLTHYSTHSASLQFRDTTEIHPGDMLLILISILRENNFRKLSKYIACIHYSPAAVTSIAKTYTHTVHILFCHVYTTAYLILISCTLLPFFKPASPRHFSLCMIR